MCLIVPADIFLKSMYSTFAQFNSPRAYWRCFDDPCSGQIVLEINPDVYIFVILIVQSGGYCLSLCILFLPGLAFLALLRVALSLREVVTPVPEKQDEFNEKA